MKVYQKLLLGLALVALLVGCVGLVAQTMNRQVEYGVLRLSQSAAQEMSAATEMRLAARESLAAARELAAERDTASASRLSTTLSRFESALDEGRSVAIEERARAERWERADDVAAADERLGTLDAVGNSFRVYQRQADRLADRVASRTGSPRAFLERSIEPQIEKALMPAVARYQGAAELAFEGEATAVQGHLKQADQFLFVSLRSGRSRHPLSL